jgi:ankyrin repeat protein
MKSSRYDVHKIERKLLQVAATGRLSRVVRLLERNGKRFARKNRKKQSRRSSSDDDEEYTTGRRHREKRKADKEYSDEEPSTSSSCDSQDEPDGKGKRKRRKHYHKASSYAKSSRKSQKNDPLRDALLNVDINCIDAEGLTPLHHACYAGCLDLVEFLLSQGADYDAEDAKGNTPLHVAARLGFTEIIGILRDAGGNMDAPNDEGVTPLMAVEARIERLRKQKEESLNPKRYVEPKHWGTRLEEELSEDESWWGHSWGEPEKKKEWWKEGWSESLFKEDDDYEFLGTSRKAKSKDPLEGGLFKELNEKRKREVEEKNREAKRILDEEIAKDKAWREKVLQKKSVDRNKVYERLWNKFMESRNLCLSYSDVPFPVEKGKEAELSRVILHNAPLSEHKQLIRKEVLRWHPGMVIFHFQHIMIWLMNLIWYVPYKGNV